MAEYWKSTPKYWCKFCSVFVKDTKFERSQHEATGRHQGNIQRSLRGIHREQENEKRQQQRAKDEVARLSGLVPSSASTTTPPASRDARAGAKPTFSKSNEKQATLDDRKRQMEQLAALGVALPDQMRGDLAMAGDWQVVSERTLGADGAPLSTGVRKRKLDEADKEALAAEETIGKKKGWGNSYKTYSGKLGGVDMDDDVDALFRKLPTKSESKAQDEPEVKTEPDDQPSAATRPEEASSAKDEDAAIISPKKEEGGSAPAVVFKKRKKKVPV